MCTIFSNTSHLFLWLLLPSFYVLFITSIFSFDLHSDELMLQYCQEELSWLDSYEWAVHATSSIHLNSYAPVLALYLYILLSFFTLSLPYISSASETAHETLI
jgi:hypothetical protein